MAACNSRRPGARACSGWESTSRRWSGPSVRSAGSASIGASDGQDGFSDLLELQGIFNINVFNLPAGPFQLAPGAQFVHEKLVTTAGSLLSSGNLIGLNALPPFPGGIREREAGFIDAKIPVTSPDSDGMSSTWVPGIRETVPAATPP